MLCVNVPFSLLTSNYIVTMFGLNLFEGLLLSLSQSTAGRIRLWLWHCHSSWHERQCSCSWDQRSSTAIQMTRHKCQIPFFSLCLSKLTPGPPPKTICLIASATAWRPFAPCAPLTISALATAILFPLARSKVSQTVKCGHSKGQTQPANGKETKNQTKSNKCQTTMKISMFACQISFLT